MLAIVKLDVIESAQIEIEIADRDSVPASEFFTISP